MAWVNTTAIATPIPANRQRRAIQRSGCMRTATVASPTIAAARAIRVPRNARGAHPSGLLAAITMTRIAG